MPSNANRLDWKTYGVDSNVDSGLSYPATAAYAVVQGYDSSGNERVIHFILTQANPGTDYNNAPNGSLAVDIANYKMYIKTAASTWTLVASNT